MKHGIIRIRVQEPHLSHVPVLEYDWEKSIYGNVKELIPTDAPKPYGKYVTATHYVDANLMHCLLTGRSVTGILTYLNKILLIGSPRNSQQLRLPRIAPSLLQQEPSLNV